MESLRNSIWSCQYGLMTASSIMLRLSAEKYDWEVNQSVMNGVVEIFGLNSQRWALINLSHFSILSDKWDILLCIQKDASLLMAS